MPLANAGYFQHVTPKSKKTILGAALDIPFQGRPCGAWKNGRMDTCALRSRAENQGKCSGRGPNQPSRFLQIEKEDVTAHTK
jgi:hypothetical protein